MKRVLFITLLSACVAGLTAFAVVKPMVSDKREQVDHVEREILPDPAMYRTVNLTHDDWPDFTFAAETAVDAVVYVKVISSGKSSQSAMPQDLFEYFFGYGTPKQPRQKIGSGSGVIIREDGYIVTNNHVVEGATEIKVTLNTNHTYDAVLVGSDPATDVALLKIEAEELPYLTFADSDKLRLGEWVIAIGSPYDLRSTITAGIVSAKGRSMPNYSGEYKVESFIQTDAAVNPGNSGGALVDKNGNLVGINTAIISQTGSYAGYSFAVPSNIVSKVVADIIEFGNVKRAVLGITMQEIDDEIADDLKLSSRKGVYIVGVSPTGAASDAGIQAADVLVAIDSIELTNAASVQEAVSRFSPGDKAVLTVIRDGKELEFEVTFKGTSQENGVRSDDGSVSLYGSVIKDAPQEKLDRFGLKHGVEIVSVGPGKMMDAGAVQGFIIMYVNEQPVKTPQDVIDAVKKSKRSVFVEGVTPSGRIGYFGFGI